MAGDRQALWAVGLSHHTAPVEIRERLALDEAGVRGVLGELTSGALVSEAMLISTCNRVELYGVAPSADGIHAFFSRYRGPQGEHIEPYLYRHSGRQAVQHLFSVAASLDSLVVGEPQILGQVKEAIRIAAESSSLGRVLHPLARRTLTVAKRVRSETTIGENRVGVGNAGVDLALQVFGSMSGKRAMLIGVGKMGRQVASALLSSGLDELLVANRTYEKSVALASETGGTAVAMERVEDYLPRADIVITATSSKRTVLTVETVQRVLRARRYQPLFLIDLAVPRNIDPDVANVDEAYLFNVDDLSKIVEEGMAARQEQARAALAMVEREAGRFVSSLHPADVQDDLKKLTSSAEAIRQVELSRSKRLVDSLDEEQRRALDALTKGLVKKLTSGSLSAIRDAASDGDFERARVLFEPWKEE